MNSVLSYTEKNTKIIHRMKAETQQKLSHTVKSNPKNEVRATDLFF